MHWEVFLAFAATNLLFAFSPGPAVLLTVSHGMRGGWRDSLRVALGVQAGNAVYFALSALGLGAVLHSSEQLFHVVKWAGAAYLVWLGIRLWRTPSSADADAPRPAVQPLQRVFRDGFVVALLNPKTTLFFAAFLPQFLDANGSPLAQTLALGGVFCAIASCTDMAYVLAASLVGPRLARASRHAAWGNRLAGSSFIGLGVLTALGHKPSH